MKKTYIYSLEYPEGNIRYIGKTNDLKKRFRNHMNKLNEDTHKNNWIKSLLKDGHKPIMKVVDEVDNEEWQFWESHYIFLYRSWGFKLTNLTFGGDGQSNVSKETREKISASVKLSYANGAIPWNKGMKGVLSGSDNYAYGKKRTDGEKEKISKTKIEYYKTHDVWNKDIKTGKTPWNKGTVGKMPIPWNKGKQGIMPQVWNKGMSMKEESKKKCSDNSPHKKILIQFSLDGEYLKEWDSKSAATKGLKKNVIVGSKSSNGYLWIYKRDYGADKSIIKKKVIAYKNKNSLKSRGKGKNNVCSKKVVQIDINTKKIIHIFNSISEAKLSTGSGNIGAVCRGKRSSANGFKWEHNE